ncbi:MAG: lipopolysaccharide heptosyltransferase II [Arenicella sp.]
MVDTFQLSQFSRCLIVAPSWVGDMVMAQSLFKALKTQNPELTIDVLAPAWCSALTDYMPEVSQLIEAPFIHGALGIAERIKLAKQLQGKYDVAFVLPNSFKSALVPWMAKIAVRVGFVGEQRYGLLNQRHKLDKRLLPLMVQRFVALAYPKAAPPVKKETLPLPRLVVKQQHLQSIMALHSLHLTNGQEVLVLCPGAEFGAAKQWPVAHYAEVANNFLDQGWQVWLFGSQKDQSACEEINVATKKACMNLAGKTTLSEAIALMSAASLVVSNDSGLMHVAAALHKKLIAVYGSTDPGFTPPLNQHAKVERIAIECSPCFKRECPLEHLDCLVKLHPSQVLKSAELLMAVE